MVRGLGIKLIKLSLILVATVIVLIVIFVLIFAIKFAWDQRSRTISTVTDGTHTITVSWNPSDWEFNSSIYVVGDIEGANEQLLLVADAIDTADVRFIDSNTIRVFLFGQHRIAVAGLKWHIIDSLDIDLSTQSEPIRWKMR